MLKQRIGKVVERKIIGIKPEASLIEAIEVMREHDISCVVAQENGKPLGILTERGLVGHLASNGRTLPKKTMREVMSSPVTTINEDSYVYEALQILVSQNIRHLVVVNDRGDSVGVLTLSNLIQGVGDDLLVEFQPVERYMSRAVISVEEDMDLFQVIKLMADKKISCLFHTLDGRIDGLITERDVVRLATKGHFLDDMRLTEVMSTPVVTVALDTPVYQVAKLMNEKHIRRVVVLDKDGQVAGLATQTNILTSLESKYIKILKQIIGEKDERLQATKIRLGKVSLYLDSILNTSIDMAIVATDENNRIIFFNFCAQTILGLSENEALGRQVTDLHDELGLDLDQFNSILEKTKAKGCHSFTFERQAEDEDKYFHTRMAVIKDDDEKIMGTVYIVRDITKQKRSEENIRYMAYHDVLTGLPNRVSFDERLRLELAHAERYKRQLAIFVLDLDNFKEINDSMGHFAGDMVLCEVADRLSGTLRKSDTVARVGGDEFMMVLPSVIGDEDALCAAAKMAEAMEKPVEVKGREWLINLSVGVSFYPNHSVHPKGLVELADKAMYTAKDEGHKNGESNICVFNDQNISCRPMRGTCRT